jgi:hypothetical protein
MPVILRIEVAGVVLPRTRRATSSNIVRAAKQGHSPDPSR